MLPTPPEGDELIPIDNLLSMRDVSMLGWFPIVTNFVNYQ